MSKQDAVGEIVEMFKRNNAKVSYVLNDMNKMTSIEFEYYGSKSYIDVIEKENTYKIICYGDYRAYVLGSNWWHVYLDDIGTKDFNLDYVASKVEAGEAYEFDPEDFIKDVKEYFEENNINADTYKDIWEAEDVEYNLNNVDGYVSAMDFVDMMDNAAELGLWEVAGKWGYRLRQHFICWMAIIRFAQEQFEKDQAE